VQKSCVSTKSIQKRSSAAEMTQNNECRQSVLTTSSDRRLAHALKNPFYQGAIYDKAQKKRTAHIHAPLNRSGKRLRESRSNPNNSKRADQLPEFTRPQAVALLPPARPVHATRARHGCAKQGQRHDGAKATKTPAPQAAPCGAARSHSGAGHVRAGRLAAPLAQTRRGPHDGDET
jgi:hypothetical protein